MSAKMMRIRDLCVGHIICVVGVFANVFTLKSTIFRSCSLQLLSNVTKTEKMSLRPEDTGVHSTAGLMLFIPQTSWTTSSAGHNQDLPLFSLSFPSPFFSSMSYSCNECSVPAFILKYTGASQILILCSMV